MNDILFCKNFRFNEYHFQENAHRDNSRGVGFHFIGFLKQGACRIVSREQALELREGDMFYIPKGCKYHSYWEANGCVRFDSIGFLHFPSAATAGYQLQKLPRDAALWEAFRPLSEDKEVNCASIGALYRLLGMLEPVLLPAPGSSETGMLEKLQLLMKENHRLTVPEYASLCGVSESLLYSCIKRISGKTPNRLRQEVMCQKAAELLSTTGYSVEEICDKLGFSSGAYFRKVFKSIYGKAPSQVRKEENKGP